MIPHLLKNRHTPCTDSESVLIKIVGDYVVELRNVFLKLYPVSVSPWYRYHTVKIKREKGYKFLHYKVGKICLTSNSRVL